MLSDKEIDKRLDEATLPEDYEKLYIDMFGEKVPTRSDTWGEFPVDMILEAIDKKKPIVHKMTQEEMQKLNPVKHSFADGCYIREIFNPANELLVTKIHKKEHPFFLLKGKMSIATEEGVKNIKAPYYGITKPGTKRVIYTHTDCIFVTVHATNSTNIEEI